uniref:Glycosyltransferase 2-like domain-containing protein n=1 Tax=Noctiluca scintillans TaxID=2966 RepID=A0A7S1AKR6_NOCSC
MHHSWLLCFVALLSEVNTESLHRRTMVLGFTGELERELEEASTSPRNSTVPAVECGTSDIEGHPCADAGETKAANGEGLEKDLKVNMVEGVGENGTWRIVRIVHPSEVVSHIRGGEVNWAVVPYLDLEAIIFMTLLCYPALLVFVLFLAVLFVSLCLETNRGAEVAPMDDSGIIPTPYKLLSQLCPSSQSLYGHWTRFCRFIPAILVFGSFFLVMICSHWYRVELFLTLLMVSSMMMFSMSSYMVCFMPLTLNRMRETIAKDPLSILDDEASVVHWVIFPNFSEPIHILKAAIQTVADSSIAKTNISLLMAMEERESDSTRKGALLREHFLDGFKEVAVVYHPSNLPHDPPGKASNVSWAFNELKKKLEVSGEDTSNMLITVADADSEFSRNYFELLTRDYLDSPNERDVVLWQSVILHMKNYHQQPGPVAIGTMFTAMLLGAQLADPNAFRLPYSTYSLSYTLAKNVGGWDVDWIGEDWHMGIKCFLLTLGKSYVKSLMVPTVNYTPEEPSYLMTLWARWSQAKRHALGFSDIVYIFMTLPLICQHLVMNSNKKVNLSNYYKLLWQVIALVIKFVNAHVILAVLTIYPIALLVLKMGLARFLSDSGAVDDFVDVIDIVSYSQNGLHVFFAASLLFTLILTFNFQMVYNLVKTRVDACQSPYDTLYNYSALHWVLLVVTLAGPGMLYFFLVGIASLISAVKCMFSYHFDYEVAPKPDEKTGEQAGV